VLHEPRMPQLAAHEAPAGQGGTQPHPGEVDGVALGHGADGIAGSTDRWISRSTAAPARTA
jgi:hypothetical protein